MPELLLHVTWQPEDGVCTVVTVDIISLTWNFSSSEVTSPCAWARGVWHLSMHWCTWDMESEGRSQHCALQLNMRPCRKTHRLSDTWDCRDQTGGNKSTTSTPPCRNIPAFYGCGPSPGFGPLIPPHFACVPGEPRPSLFVPWSFHRCSRRVYQITRTGLALPAVSTAKLSPSGFTM